MAEVLGPREACVAREVTKRHEEARAATLPELAAHYQAAGVLGECVIVVAPPAESDAPATDAETLDAKLRAAIRRSDPICRPRLNRRPRRTPPFGWDG